MVICFYAIVDSLGDNLATNNISVDDLRRKYAFDKVYAHFSAVPDYDKIDHSLCMVRLSFPVSEFVKLYPYFTFKDLSAIAFVHGLQPFSSARKLDLLQLLLKHDCSQCTEHTVYVFKSLSRDR